MKAENRKKNSVNTIMQKIEKRPLTFIAILVTGALVGGLLSFGAMMIPGLIFIETIKRITPAERATFKLPN